MSKYLFFDDRNIPRCLLVITVVFLVIIYSRVHMVAGDPPVWTEEAFIVDGGWWGTGARGKVLFDDYHAVDFGGTYLVTPLYNWSLQTVYMLWGFGQGQAQLLSALSNILTILIVAVLLWKQAGIRQSVIATLLLGLSPFFWNQGRIALPESLQCLFVVASYSLLITANRLRKAAFISGFLMAMAMAVKPTAALVGFFPLMATCFFAYYIKRPEVSSGVTGVRRALPLPAVLLVLTGALIGFCLILFTHVLPHREIFKTMFFSESAGAYPIDWKQLLTLPGRAVISKEISEDGSFSPVLWRVALWSPLIFLSLWMYLLGLLRKCHGGVRKTFFSMDQLEAMTVVWLLTAWIGIFGLMGQPDYRYVPLIPMMAVLATLYLSRNVFVDLAAAPEGKINVEKKPGYFYSYILWFAMLLPVMIIVKPAGIRWIISAGTNVFIGDQPGISYGAAGTLFMSGWFLILTIAAFFRKSILSLSSLLLERRMLACVVILVTFEFLLLSYSLFSVEASLCARQSELANVVPENNVVVGRMSGTLLYPHRVHSMRRIKPNYPPLEIATETTHLERWNSVRPDYFLITKQMNFKPWKPYKSMSQDLTREGYSAVRCLGVGPFINGTPRFELELYRKIPAATGY